MRKFNRSNVKSFCGIIDNNKVLKGSFLNFSRMGAMVSTDSMLTKQHYVSVMYQNEKNEFIRMLTYVVHSVKKGSHFVSGLQFVGVEERK